MLCPTRAALGKPRESIKLMIESRKKSSAALTDMLPVGQFSSLGLSPAPRQSRLKTGPLWRWAMRAKF
jgi:hypothetical protein